MELDRRFVPPQPGITPNQSGPERKGNSKERKTARKNSKENSNGKNRKFKFCSAPLIIERVAPREAILSRPISVGPAPVVGSYSLYFLLLPGN